MKKTIGRFPKWELFSVPFDVFVVFVWLPLQASVNRKMAVTLHTSLGDIKVELYCEDAPLACENFLARCASGYYDNTVFHRNVKGFIVQGGDPSGSGFGGESIWGQPVRHVSD
tara:strand:+ start:151 stop:489 length:339 start_codon:yes stop_codon:yes gene_type:complete